MRDCPRCGVRNDDAAASCAACGTALPHFAAAAAAGPPGASPPPGPASPGSPVPAGPLAETALSAEAVRVAPGAAATATIEVRNVGRVPDRFELELMGDAAAWASVEPAALDLGPGDAGRATIRFQPPLEPAPPPGGVDYAVRIRSVAHPGLAALEFGEVVIEAAPAAPPGPRPAREPAPTTGPTPAPAPAVARPRRRRPAIAAVLALAAIAAVVAAALLAVGFRPAPAPSSSPTPRSATAAPTPTTAPSPSPAPTRAPTSTPRPTPTPSPAGSPVAWWQDLHDEAALAGVELGALVAEGTTDENLPYAVFAGGAVYQRVDDAHWLAGPAWTLWTSLGGGASAPAALGYPSSRPLGSGAGGRQLFDRGAVFWSARTMPHAVHGRTWDAWRQLVRDQGRDVADPAGDGLVTPLGYPVGDVLGTATWEWVELEAGIVGVRADGTPFACSTASPPAGFPGCGEVP